MTDGANLRRDALFRRLLAGAGMLGAFGLLAGAFDGPDWGAYALWSNAFHNADLFRIPSTTGSPLGVPVTQWSHGPGLAFATGRAVIGAFTPDMVVGWLSAVLFWWLAWFTFRELAPGSVLLPVAGLGLLFVGTHAGFYSLAHASESLSLAPIALLMWLALRRAGLEPSDALWIGVATASLVLVRSYLAVYALPAIVRMLLALRGRRPGAWLRAAALAAAPVALALAQVALVNRWMTGSPERSVYVFGDEGFRSLDFTDPELAAVLFHPLRGLLVYHPLYALGFLALLALMFASWQRSRSEPRDGGGDEKRSSPDEATRDTSEGKPQRHGGAIPRPILVAIAIAVLLNLWVQAAWYVWWLGGRTFGMRGMVGAALPLIAALVAWSAVLSPRARIAALGAALLASAWSFPFLMRGIPGALGWRGVFAIFADHATGLLREHGLMLVAVAVIGFVLLRWLPAAPESTTLQAAASTLVSAAAIHLYDVARGTPALEIGARAYGAALLLLLFGCLLAAVLPAIEGWTWSARTLARRWPIGERPGSSKAADSRPFRSPRRPQPEHVAGLVLLIGLLGGAGLFVALARNTEAGLRDGTLPRREFQDLAPFLVQEVRASYAEYQAIPGFEDKKQALHGFLQRGEYLR